MNINPEAFVESLPIMGIGMVGIFVVTIVIVAVVTCLNKLTSLSFKKINQQ